MGQGVSSSAPRCFVLGPPRATHRSRTVPPTTILPTSSERFLNVPPPCSKSESDLVETGIRRVNAPGVRNRNWGSGRGSGPRERLLEDLRRDDSALVAERTEMEVVRIEHLELIGEPRRELA